MAGAAAAGGGGWRQEEEEGEYTHGKIWQFAPCFFLLYLVQLVSVAEAAAEGRRGAERRGIWEVVCDVCSSVVSEIQDSEATYWQFLLIFVLVLLHLI